MEKQAEGREVIYTAKVSDFAMLPPSNSWRAAAALGSCAAGGGSSVIGRSTRTNMVSFP